VAGSASAAIVPKPGAGDPRVQTIDYDAEQIVTLRVALGYALTLEFSPDERIENVAVGNSAVWQVTPNKGADHLFVKPMQGAVDTDMTVITDARSYNFELKAAPGPDPNMAFMVRILYPVAATVAEATPQPQVSTYRFSGSRGLQPAEMSDDGRSTYMTWGPKTAIPAVFIIDAQGRDALVNGAVRGGRFVVDQIANQFIFRLGDQEARAYRHVIKVRKR
jgi:type IV secretion system protein VirB9